MKVFAKNEKAPGRIAVGVVVLVALLSTAGTAQSQDLKKRYPQMAPIDRYLMDRDAEISLARSAAPEAVSKDATVLVLGRHGYETAFKGTNGFVCMVERAWSMAIDFPEIWNPKILGPDCLNPPAARSILPIEEKKVELTLAGNSQDKIIAAMRAAFQTGELPGLEPGAMGYMMSKRAYLTDAGGHNGPHLMVFTNLADNKLWGANLPNSPVVAAFYWFPTDDANPLGKGLPMMRVFAVRVAKWSDGTAVVPMH